MKSEVISLMSKHIFSTAQGKYLDLLLEILSFESNLTTLTTVVSDSSVNLNYYADDNKFNLIYEWEVYSEKATEDDRILVENFEAKEYKKSIFKAIVVDRRMYFGKKTKVRQDYLPRFSDGELEDKLIKMTATLLREFDKKRPDICVLFSLTNVQDFIIYAICKARGIKFILLRSAKIENFITAFDDPFGKQFFPQNEISAHLCNIAENYINSVRADSNVAYEGALISKKFNITTATKRIIAGALADLRRLKHPVKRNDNQLEKLFRNNCYSEILNPIKWKLQKKIYFSKAIQPEESYFVYPLHFEPEVAIQFYGSSYLNQIELIRNLAMSLPVKSKLLVKEHPRSFGVRSNRYYSKICQIPRVQLADVRVSMQDLITNSRGVFTISGSTGLEAILRGKPCWTFGKPYFAFISDYMVSYIDNISDLDQKIVSLLENYKFDKEILVKFLASILSNSVRFDLYSGYLEKSDRRSGYMSSKEVRSLYELIFKT